MFYVGSVTGESS